MEEKPIKFNPYCFEFLKFLFSHFFVMPLKVL